LAQWWTDFQEVSADAQVQMVKATRSAQGTKRSKPRRRRKLNAKKAE
jgi:poly(A) polymerase